MQQLLTWPGSAWLLLSLSCVPVEHLVYVPCTNYVWTSHVETKDGRRDFFPEDCNILDFLSTLFQLIFSQLRKTPTVPLHLLHTVLAAHCAQNNTKKWRFSRATICMVFLLWDMIFTKVITWAEKISTLYTQLLFIRDAMSARLRSTVQRSDSVNRARSRVARNWEFSQFWGFWRPCWEIF